MKAPFTYIMRKLIGFFIKGLLVVLPLGITVFLFTNIINWVDSYVNFGFPGSGLLMVIAGITLLGFLLSGLLGNTLMILLDDFLSRIPFIKLVYTSVKDLVEAFMGEKKKFNEPVRVQISEYTHSLGFVTRQDLAGIGMPGFTAVYFPYSYTLTGRVLLVPSRHIIRVQANAAEVMKFVVSGGVTGFHE